jgi:DNA-binding transcriptional ArsR family regulator
MPRKTAAARHADSTPPQDTWPPTGDDLVEALIAVQHPARRRLYETLLMSGPASVGDLAQRTGLAPGSVSHHLKALHRTGFVEPAPELAHDTRQSWWRAHRRKLTWSADEWAAGTAARQVADLAERANLEHHVRETVRWMRERDSLPGAWRSVGLSTDHLVAATREQYDDLETRLMSVINDWQLECRSDEDVHPDLARHSVRVIARVFPSDPA